MNISKIRFIERKALLINFNGFTKVMQELLDDSTVKIEKDYPVLSMYSEWHDCRYDEGEIIERISGYLEVNIVACFMYIDLEQIYFVCDSNINN